MQIGPTAPYARRIELGYRRHRGGGRGRGSRRPQPYFGPAFREFIPRYPDLMARAAWNPSRLRGFRYG
jgi:hypothetical protein